MDTFLRSFYLFTLTFYLVLSPATAAVAVNDIFPLNPGNTWTYRDLEGNLETLVIRQVLERGGIPLIEAAYDGSRSFYYILCREGVYRLEATAGIPVEEPKGDLTLLLRWPLDPGQTWQSPWSDPPLSFTVLDRGPVKVAAGTFRDAVKIGYRALSSPIYQGYLWVEPGVGLLAQEKSAYRTELVSYSLSDLLAPTAVAVDGDRLAQIFKPPGTEKQLRPTGIWPQVKDLVFSAPFYLFILLVVIGFIAAVSYLNSRKVEMDFMNDPEVQEGELTLASAMVREGLYKDASMILQRLSAKHPQWPDIAALLGSAYREMGRFQEASLEFKRALTLNPDMAKARLELVRTYLSLNEPARALEEVETVLGDHPEFPDAVYLKGEVLSAMGMNQKALEHFREALGINPSFAEAQKALERVLSEEE